MSRRVTWAAIGLKSVGWGFGGVTIEEARGKAEVGICYSWGPYDSAGNTVINKNSSFSRQDISYGFTTIALIASQNLRIAVIQLCKY